MRPTTFLISVRVPRRFVTLSALASLLMMVFGNGVLAEDKIDFETQVRPILTARCVACHGAAMQEGGLRLDAKAFALKGGDSGAVIVPSKSGESELFRRITSADKNDAMPPKGERLTADEIARLRRWIDSGALWLETDADRNAARDPKLDHWAWQPIAKPPVPSPKTSGWARTEIDRFILAKLEEKQLRPSRIADPRTLIRRLSFDLLGLPPTPEEVDQFVRAWEVELRRGDGETRQRNGGNEGKKERGTAGKTEENSPSNPPSLIPSVPPSLRPSAPESPRLPLSPSTSPHVSASPLPTAYEQLVARLLRSPRYGERWARHWLDVVHYGDTHGYDKDKPRPNSWPYRDYVIRALNEDKPYARFVQEQVAGDVLFPGTRDGIEGLGFIAAGPWDFIGHAEVPESKIDGKIARHLDRDDMVGNTLGTFCSVTIQCAQCHNHKFDPFTQEDYYSLQAVFAALDRADRKYFADAEKTRRYHELEREQQRLAERRKQLEALPRQKAGAALVTLEKRIDAASKKLTGNTRAEFGYHSAISPKQHVTKWVQLDLGASVVLDRVVLLPCYDDFNKIGAGFGFPVRYRVEVSDDAEFKTPPQLIASRDSDDTTNPQTTPQSFVANGATGRYLRVTATKLAPRQNDFIFALAELQAFDTTGKNVAEQAKVSALDSIEAPPRWRKANLVDSFAPIADSSGELAKLQAERDALLKGSLDEATARELTDIATKLSQVASELKKFPAPDVIYAGTIHFGSGAFAGTGAAGGKPRKISLLSRGNVLQPLREVGPGAIASLAPLTGRFELPADHSEADRRAALARWLTDERHPLTWRSIVNRVWQYHFGRGLVETSNDFGRMGAAPTHPELLDWLAADFRDHGGSLKRLHQQIVTSSVYMQISDLGFVIEDGKSAGRESSVPPQAIDSDNRFLWRQNRRKLEAEAVRDAVLAVSGKLDLTMGGAGYQDFVIEHPAHSPHYEYHLANPNDPKTWRRSIYRFIVRSQTQPFMTSLDCADPSMRVEKRNESVSALQALTLLNNGVMVTQANYFAARVREVAEDDERKQLETAFRLALGRAPVAEERDVLLRYLRENGLANLCRVLFNLNEFVFVD